MNAKSTISVLELFSENYLHSLKIFEDLLLSVAFFRERSALWCLISTAISVNIVEICLSCFLETKALFHILKMLLIIKEKKIPFMCPRLRI